MITGQPVLKRFDSNNPASWQLSLVLIGWMLVSSVSQACLLHYQQPVHARAVFDELPEGAVADIRLTTPSSAYQQTLIQQLVETPLSASVVDDGGIVQNEDEPFDAVPIEPGHSGAWHNPQRAGEGWQVEILSADEALSFWFTYTPTAAPAAAEDRGQFWMGGPGRIEGNRIIIDDVITTSGGIFGPQFDPDNVVRTRWGRYVIEFSSCQHGRILYEGPPEFGSGEIAIERLTGNPRMPCGTAVSGFPPPSAEVPGVSGNWFDPTHDGEGWFIQEVAPGLAGFSWLSYDNQGRQAWFLGVGFWQGRALIVPAMQITRGVAFGDAFDPASVVREDWGAVQFVFHSCTSATMTYASPLAGYGAGKLEPVQLTRASTLPCAFDELPDVSAARWASRGGAPTLSELPSAVLDGQIYVGGGLRGAFRGQRDFWRYEPDTQVWTRLSDLPQARDHGMMVAYDGALYYFGGFVEFVPTASIWRYDPHADQWSVLGVMPGARAAGGAAVLNERIYLWGGERGFIDIYNPATAEWESVAFSETVGRDHSSVVAYQGEIWLIGGRLGGIAHGAVSIYSPLTGVVRAGPRLREGRSGFAAVAYQGQIVVAGGENFSPLVTLGSVEYYNPEAGGWQLTASLPTPVHGVSGVQVDDQLYLILGSTLTGGVSNPGVVQVLSLP
ncbi:MAG: hypothetical protein Tsb002_18880 [Wenzhouxiangellaceae bacterium]